jgi:hypothetical protein
MVSKAKPRKESSLKSKKRTYACPNPGPPFCVKAIVKKILRDKVFAKFIAEQLCKAHRDDPEAIRCVKSYFKPTDDELDQLCIPPSKRRKLFICTDPTHLYLIDVAAHGASGTRKR